VISRSLNRNDEEEEEHRSAVLQVRNAQTLHKRGKLIKNKRKTLVKLTSGYEMDLTKKPQVQESTQTAYNKMCKMND